MRTLIAFLLALLVLENAFSSSSNAEGVFQESNSLACKTTTDAQETSKVDILCLYFVFPELFVARSEYRGAKNLEARIQESMPILIDEIFFCPFQCGTLLPPSSLAVH